MQELLQYVRQQYIWEAQRRDKLNSASSVPIGFATLAGTIGISISSRISKPFSQTETIVLIGLSLALIASLYAMYQVVKFFMGPIYKYVSDAESVKVFYNTSKDYYREYPNLGNISSAFEDYLVNTYSKCAAINCENNDKKSRCLYRLNLAVLWMLVPCILSGGVLMIANLFFAK